jgi:NAD(P)-dependent dehydrogenase (short-subunit alcohol dehydrogenase family)
MGRVSGKIARVSGDASGLEYTVATALMREGAKVVIAQIIGSAGRELGYPVFYIDNALTVR